jgi:hypothetical protein
MNETDCAACSLQPTLPAIPRNYSLRQIAVRRTSDTSVTIRNPKPVKNLEHRTAKVTSRSASQHAFRSATRSAFRLGRGILRSFVGPWMHPETDAQCHHCLLTSANRAKSEHYLRRRSPRKNVQAFRAGTPCSRDGRHFERLSTCPDDGIGAVGPRGTRQTGRVISHDQRARSGAEAGVEPPERPRITSDSRAGAGSRDAEPLA